MDRREVIFKKRIEPIGYSLGSKGEGWPRPYLPTRDHDNQSQVGSDPVVSLTRGPDGAMGGSSWWSVWTQNLKHSHLATEAEQKGQRTQVLPVKVGCRGSVGMSTTSLLKGIGVKGQVLWQAVKSLAEAKNKWQLDLAEKKWQELGSKMTTSQQEG